MPVYTGSDVQNLIDQINLDNPQLPWALNEVDFVYGIPAAVAQPVGGLNTSIKVTCKGSSKYRGSMTLTYRRRDLTNLFRGQVINLSRWIDSGNMGLSGFIPLINSSFGLNLEASKMTINGEWAIGNSGQSRVISAAASNKAYVGSIAVIWNRGVQELGLDVLTLTDLDGALWPGGNDFTAYSDRSVFGNFLLSGLDITDYAMANNWIGGNYNIGTVLRNAIIDHLAQVTGLGISTGAYDPVTQPYGLGAAGTTPIISVALPSALYPEANKPGFANAMIVLATGHPTFKSNIVAYYNL